MVKKLALAIAGLLAILIVMGVAGFRLALDGSGKMPRFLVRPNAGALEEHRARQRDHLGASDARTSPVTRPGDRSPANTATDQASQAATSDSGKQDLAHARKEHEPARADSSPKPSSPAMWTDFRGPNRDGRYAASSIRTSWPREGLPRLWKQPVGEGYASFVVADGRAFTIEQRRNQEVVAAYDMQTGRELWTNAWNAYFQEGLGGDGPRATPTYHEGRIYALGAEGEFRVLDAANGTVIWRKNILADNGARNISWGMSASPLVVDDKVVVLPGGSADRSVVAYNELTGAPVWKVLGDEQAYTSPMLATIGGVRQIVVVSAIRAVGLTPENGTLLWEYPWVTSMGINVAQPLIFKHNGSDRIFLSASYGHGAAVFELTKSGDRFQTKTIWENQRMKNKFTSSVLHNGHIYGLDESILACIDAATGEQKWKAGRYGYGQLMLAGNHLIVLTEDGDLVLVNATPARHEELAQFRAIEGKTWNHPAIAEGKLLVRNLQEMAAFDVR
jgi:outer membrane protein assembly factor BamB